MNVKLEPDDVSAEIFYYQRNVQRLRIAKGWDESALARAASMSVQHVRNLEAGRSAGSVQALIRIRKALRVSYDELFSENR